MVASRSGSASRWLSRAVARRRREMSPACSSTFKCRETAGWVISKGAASSATVASPAVRREDGTTGGIGERAEYGTELIDGHSITNSF